MSSDNYLPYDTIVAAVAGEKWALEEVANHYSNYIDELCTVKKMLPDGTTQKFIDEDKRQELITHLLEEVRKFPLNDPDKLNEVLDDENA